ncbi:hypothetical protein [Gordonia zhaorongruii]|uniref:hypothetical protein n=1 Tax=Gordonia zhaorongruii TaxID=2597659 RepID=UPI00140465D0|nr:hypothetical protein [Gordonia zhaorongruii]
MSGFIDRIKQAAEALRARLGNELTVLEGAGGDDALAHHDDTPTTDKSANDEDPGEL